MIYITKHVNTYTFINGNDNSTAVPFYLKCNYFFSKGPVGFPGDPGPPGEPGVAVSMTSNIRS